jgi:hypothetical protein
MVTAALELADLLVADDEWVDREFEAIIAFGWDDAEPPARPAAGRGGLRPRGPRSDTVHGCVRQRRGRRSAATAWAHQRGPPAPPGHSRAAA